MYKKEDLYEPYNDFGKDKERIKECIKEVQSLMKYYSIDDFKYNPSKVSKGNLSTHIKRVFSISSLSQSVVPSISQMRKELVELMNFLNLCNGSTLYLDSTISNPHGKQTKGQVLKMGITSKELLTWLELFAHSLFYENYSDYYEVRENDRKKEIFPEDDALYFFKKPYTEGQIEQLYIEYVEKEKAQKKMPENAKRGIIAISIEEAFKAWEKSKDMTKTKLYSFIYDVMHIFGEEGDKGFIGEEFSGEVGREKQREVRNWIEAFKSYQRQKETEEEYPE